MPTRQAYVYTDLRSPTEIRLLTLHPGVYGEDLYCSLSHHRLESPPSYEALSYTWGDESQKRTLSCRGTGDTYRSLLITSNCYDALQRLRLVNNTRCLWVDAICINQTDQEKNAQVALMPRIYQEASQVVIFVGEEYDASQLTLDMALAASDTGAPPGRSRAVFEPWERAIVRAFMSRPWFTRVWVLQEVFLSKEALLVCGETEVPWKKFAMLVFRHQQELIGGSNLLTIPHALNINPWAKEKLPLLAVLQKTRFYKCKDARDKVFAIAGMVDRPSLTCLSPDYTKSAVDVYTTVAKFLLEDTGLMFLGCAQSPSLLPGCPSWVPDWSQDPDYPPLLRFNEEDMRWNDTKMAGGSSDLTKAQFLSDTRTDTASCLKVRGLRVGAISSVGEGCEKIDFYWKNKILAWLDSAPLDEFTNSGISLKDALLQVLIPTGSHAASLRILQMLTNPVHGRTDGSTETLDARYKIHIRGQRLLNVDGGYIGLGPLAARQGDVVCILCGAKAPFVLRCIQDGYQIVGECRLNDVMAGALLQGIDSRTTFTDEPESPLEDFLIY